MGIASASVVHTPDELDARVRYILAHYRQPALVEEYIEGREINVSVLDRPRGALRWCSPCTRSTSPRCRADRPKIVSFEGKWVESSADYRGTRPVPLPAARSGAPRVEQVALAAFPALELRDYGRVDVRLSADGTP